MRVIVVGSGMSGLTAGRRLRDRGLEVVIVDKGRRPGGRMATRTAGAARFDHGAQHFSARSPEFARATAQWIDQGAVGVWFDSHSVTRPHRGMEPRHVGVDGMRRIPELLARDLEVHQSVHVDRVEIRDDGVVVVDRSQRALHGDAAIITPPAPQALSILDRGGIPVDPDVRTELARLAYDACLTVMAVPIGPVDLPDGHLTPGSGPVAWIADNRAKGASRAPAITVQSTAAFAAAHLEQPRGVWAAFLADAAEGHLRVPLEIVASHRWRYSQPRSTWDIGALGVSGTPPVVLAGEAFAGARIEGAFLSGVAASDLITG